MNLSRKILHVDMDAFYASVEQRDNPSLRGQPVVVGGQTRGVVAAASYEARRFGIHSAMPMRDALKRCPNLVSLPPRISHYRSVSQEVFLIFREFTPLVEGLSLDEAFLDVGSSLKLFGDEVAIAREIKARIHERTALTASVGVAPNKLLAKIASDLEKPDGLFIITEKNIREVLDPLPVRTIPGIGPETLSRLKPIHIETIADLRLAPDRDLEAIFGRFMGRTRDQAAGIDDRPVEPSQADKSISTEETFDTDLANRKDMQRELLRLCERTSSRLRAKDLVAGTVQVKVRQSDFKTFTRQRALSPPGNGAETFFAAAIKLLDAWRDEFPAARVRLLGVGGSRLAKDAQLDLFSPVPNRRISGINQTIDEIRDRFGSNALSRARAMDPDQIR